MENTNGIVYGNSDKNVSKSLFVAVRIASLIANGVSENNVRSDMYSVFLSFMAKMSPVNSPVNGSSNMPPDDPLHARLIQFGFVDAWEALHPGTPHPHTFRVHEREAGESPYCCDYVFVTEDLVPRLRSIRVDGANRASDHQPVIVELE